MFCKKLIHLIFIIKIFIYFYTYIVLLNSVNPALVLGAKIQKRTRQRQQLLFWHLHSKERILKETSKFKTKGCDFVFS